MLKDSDMCPGRILGTTMEIRRVLLFWGSLPLKSNILGQSACSYAIPLWQGCFPMGMNTGIEFAVEYVASIPIWCAKGEFVIYYCYLIVSKYPEKLTTASN